MKPPILLLHGACSRPAHLEPWRAWFTAAGYRCAVPALPGHGDGDEVVLARLGMDDCLAAVSASWAAFDSPPVVVGHSLGGLLAQQLAARAECAAIILVASLPPARLPLTLEALPYYLPLMPRILAGRPIHPTRAALEALSLHDLSVAEREELLPDFGPESGRVYRSLALGLARVERRAMRCPVFVIHGQADRQVPLSVARRLATRYRAELVVVPGHGHWLIAGSLIGLAASPVLAWIEELGRGARPSFPPDGAV